jgi:hypothetical protein
MAMAIDNRNRYTDPRELVLDAEPHTTNPAYRIFRDAANLEAQVVTYQTETASPIEDEVKTLGKEISALALNLYCNTNQPNLNEINSLGWLFLNDNSATYKSLELMRQNGKMPNGLDLASLQYARVLNENPKALHQINQYFLTNLEFVENVDKLKEVHVNINLWIPEGRFQIIHPTRPFSATLGLTDQTPNGVLLKSLAINKTV